MDSDHHHFKISDPHTDKLFHAILQLRNIDEYYKDICILNQVHVLS